MPGELAGNESAQHRREATGQAAAQLVGDRNARVTHPGREGFGHVAGNYRIQCRQHDHGQGDAGRHVDHIAGLYQQEHRVRHHHAQRSYPCQETPFAQALGEHGRTGLREKLQDGDHEQAIENGGLGDALILGDVGDHEGVGEEEPARADGYGQGCEDDVAPVIAQHFAHRVVAGLVTVLDLGKLW
ncbi:hypothetical protein D3C79_801280 [compost metagenome]